MSQVSVGDGLGRVSRRGRAANSCVSVERDTELHGGETVYFLITTKPIS